MKKAFSLMILGAILATAQITTPPNGSTIVAGNTVNFCWQMGGQALANAGGPSGIPNYSNGFWYAVLTISSTSQVVLGSGAFTAAGCFAATPSSTGAINITMLMQTCSSCSGTYWYFQYPVVSTAPTLQSTLTESNVSLGPGAPPDDYQPLGSSSDIAQGKTATQSSTYDGVSGPAYVAVDGNTDGVYFDGSVTSTNDDVNAWWEVDLGSPGDIQQINIWNRTDCCQDRLSDYWVFISNTPFQPTDTPATLATRAGTWASHQTSMPNPETVIPVGGTAGEYVRVQLTGQNYLSLAEVQVMGAFDGGGAAAPAVVSRTKRVNLFHGVAEIPRGDLVNLGAFRYQFSGSGPWTYQYTLDNSDVASIRLGDLHDLSLGTISSAEPSGWAGRGLVGWFAAKGPERSAAAQYTVVSSKSPGLQPMFFQSDYLGYAAAMNGGPAPDMLPMTGDDKDDQLITRAGGIFGNSVKQFVIGPVFDRGVTKDQILERVGVWVKSYGFAFLAPLLTGGSLSDLQPSSQIEKDLVTALSQVWQ